MRSTLPVGTFHKTTEAFPLALARSIGVRDEELYDPMRHGSRTGAFDA